MTVRANFYPARNSDPTAIACYTFSDSNPSELAQFGRYLNRGYGGAAYDLTTRVGTPLVGQGGGVYVLDTATSYWQGAIYVGGSRIRAMLNATSAPAATRAVFQNGNRYLIYLSANNEPYISLDAGGTYTGWLVNMSNRGPFVVDGWLTTGLMQRLYVNGVYRNQGGPVVAGVTAGSMQVGRHSEIRLGQVFDPVIALVSDATIRASYVRDFARKVLWQWTPTNEMASIPTGTVGDDWTCPLGAATMGVVWRTDLSSPSGGRLALTDTQTAALNRIDFEFGSRPLFGTWIVEYQIRDPATDSLVVGFTPRRGADAMAAASQSYWCWVRTAAGPWWRVSMGYENNTAVPIDSADAPWPGPNANDRCIAVVSRDVDGSVQTWNYVPNPQRGWWWSAVEGNHVTTLSEGCISIAPRGAYIERVSWLQGSCTPHEIGLTVP